MTGAAAPVPGFLQPAAPVTVMAACIVGGVGDASEDLKALSARCEALTAETERLRGELKKTQEEGAACEARSARFQAELEDERTWRWNWKYVRLSSPLTTHAEVLTCSVDAGWAWKWYATSCPCCKRPIDVTLLAEASADNPPPPTQSQHMVSAAVASSAPAVSPPKTASIVASTPAVAPIVTSLLSPSSAPAPSLVPVPMPLTGPVAEPLAELAPVVPALVHAGIGDEQRGHKRGREEEPACAPVAVAIENQGPPVKAIAEPGQERHAYCAALWGANAGYALGAAVLCARLRELDTRGTDRVLLHTDDVPANYLAALAEAGWALRCVEYLDGTPALYSSRGTIFDGVFTKLRAWGLEEYDKVLLLDLDVIPLKPLDSLFELRPPAALVRGNSHELPNGARVDGRRFFAGEDCEPMFAWGQSGGINAGVILLRPCRSTLARMVSEVGSENHPEHIPGNGPEQDYLTRFFASAPWHSLHVAWNYQLHHVFFALEKALTCRWVSAAAAERASGNSSAAELMPNADGVAAPEWLPQRLAVLVDEIGLVHFSGDVKLWHMYLETSAAVQAEAAADGQALRLATEHTACAARPRALGAEGIPEVEDDALEIERDWAFAERIMRTCQGYRRWVERTELPEEYAKFGCTLADGGRLKLLAGCVGGDGAVSTSVSSARETVHDVTDLMEAGVAQLRGAARQATSSWRACAQRLLHGAPSLLQELQCPGVPAGCLSIGTRVEVSWRPGGDIAGPAAPAAPAAASPLPGAAAVLAGERIGEGSGETVAEGGAGAVVWLPGKVVAVHADGRYVVKLVQGGTWGDTERRVEAKRLRTLIA